MDMLNPKIYKGDYSELAFEIKKEEITKEKYEQEKIFDFFAILEEAAKENADNAHIFKVKKDNKYEKITVKIETKNAKSSYKIIYKNNVLKDKKITKEFKEKLEKLEGDLYIQTTPNLFFMSNKQQEWGVIDKSGNIIIQCKYNNIERYKNNFVCHTGTLMADIVDTKGQILSPDVEIMDDKLDYVIVLDKFGKVGMLNKNTGKYLPPYFDKYGCYPYYVVVNKNNKWAVLTPDLKFITDFEFDDIDLENRHIHHLLKVKQGDKWGLIDTYNKTKILNCEYDEIKIESFKRLPKFETEKENQIDDEYKNNTYTYKDFIF